MLRYYPHHYAPYLSDVKGFSDFKIEFDPGRPFLPFQQLMAVLPTASKGLLPEALQVISSVVVTLFTLIIICLYLLCSFIIGRTAMIVWLYESNHFVLRPTLGVLEKGTLLIVWVKMFYCF